MSERKVGEPTHHFAPGMFMIHDIDRNSLGDLLKIARAMADTPVVEYSEWWDELRGPGRRCSVCGATEAESEPGFDATRPMAPEKHHDGCAHVLAQRLAVRSRTP